MPVHSEMMAFETTCFAFDLLELPCAASMPVHSEMMAFETTCFAFDLLELY